MPKFASYTQRIQIRNGQYGGVLFVISVIVDACGHRFEMFTLVSEILENVDLVLGIKNIFELEGVIDSHDSSFSFLNRSILFFPREKIEIKPKEQRLVIIEAPFYIRYVRNCNCKIIRYVRTSYSNVEIKIHKEYGNTEIYK